MAAGYSSAEFTMASEQFTSDHGKPVIIMVHSDRGKNLVSAASRLTRLSDYKTKWVLCPSGAQFRNGGGLPRGIVLC